MSGELDEDPYGIDEDVGGEGSDHDNNEDEFENMLGVRAKNIWVDQGAKKNEVMQELIKCFGSMVESHPMEYALPDHTGRFKPEDMIFEKLLDAPKYVAKAKRFVC